MSQYTPTQQRIMALLSDGEYHPRKDLLACLDDELATPRALTQHIVRLRKLLRYKGEGILCEQKNMRIGYRHVRFLPPVA